MLELRDAMLVDRLNKAYLKHRVLSELERLQSLSARIGLYQSKDQKALSSLKGRYKGRSAMIIGNGPSLTMEDLTAIDEKGFVSIASNRIYLAFDKTPWRPHVVTAADELVIEQSIDEINAIDCPKIYPSRLRHHFDASTTPPRGENIFFRSRTTAERDPRRYAPVIPDNGLDGFFVGQTVTVLNIQIAYWLGCTKIYLIGLDGKYDIADVRTKHKSYGSVAVSTGETNHFASGYRKEGESWSVPRPDLHEIEYRACRTFLEARNILLVNASRVSYVEAFDRVDLDSVLEKI